MIEFELFPTEDGITDISLVEYPATESNFLCFSKDTKQYFFSNSEKHIITGAVLIPNKPIYRYDNQFGEYNVFFSPDTIRAISEKFLQNFKNKSFTIEHGDNTNNVSVVESWIKDYTADKSNEMGFNLPVGTWFISAKVNSPDLWQSIKDGQFNGFSVAGYFKTENPIINEAEELINQLENRE